MRTLTSYLSSLPTDIRDQLQKELERLGKSVATEAISASIGRIIVKAIDTAVAAAVKALTEEKVEGFIAAYHDSLQEQLEQFSLAMDQYIPLQIEVELAKKKHGAKSEETKKARKRRTLGLAEVREEIRDVLLSATGQQPHD